jgi:transposase-like protein
MTRDKCKGGRINLQEIFGVNKDGFKELLREVLQEVLEQEMTDALGAEKGERSPGRLGYRCGYYSRGLVTRVGNWSCAFLRTGRDIFPPRFLSGTRGRKRPWYQPWRRCTSRGCPPGR